MTTCKIFKLPVLCCAVLSRSAMSTLYCPVDCSLPSSSVPGDSPGKNTGMGCHALLQGIFPTQGSNPGLPHCRQILYYLSHQGSPVSCLPKGHFYHSFLLQNCNLIWYVPISLLLMIMDCINKLFEYINDS